MTAVVFAPDWRRGNPYQALLAGELARLGDDVDFAGETRRGLPLTRLVRSRRFDVFHLHWPEAYLSRRNDGLDWARRLRFSGDVAMAFSRARLVTTAHNLIWHNRAGEPLIRRNVASVFERSRIIFAHSDAGAGRLARTFDIPRDRIVVIPHGDLSAHVGPPLPRAEARAMLGLGGEALALMFGVIEPYKGIEEIAGWWRRRRPDVRLAVVGRPYLASYGAQIEREMAGLNGVLSLGWMEDQALRLWLSAADVVVFNYRQIFTSGAACLARSYGVPLLMPDRLDTVFLDEPSPYVERFGDVETSFGAALEAALAVPPSFEAAAGWRALTAWDRVAAATSEAYRRIL
jgi:glycosyltransferase involved in cell wall biosynthesis